MGVGSRRRYRREAGTEEVQSGGEPGEPRRRQRSRLRPGRARGQRKPAGPGSPAGPRRASGRPPSLAPPRQRPVTCWSPAKNTAPARPGGSAGRTARVGPAGNPAALLLRSPPVCRPPWRPCCSGSDPHRDPEAVGARSEGYASRPGWGQEPAPDRETWETHLVDHRKPQWCGSPVLALGWTVFSTQSFPFSRLVKSVHKCMP